MVSIKKEGNDFIFEVKGVHKLWAFKSQITIPADNILKVHRDLESVNGWAGWRMPGIFITSTLTAGTFYKDGEKNFWDVANMNNCIIVDLKDEDYNQLIIEVENPEEAIGVLNG